MACESNYYEVKILINQIAKLLLDYGADPTIKDSTGLSCLHLAAKEGYLEICLLLISRGCDKDLRDVFGNNAAYWAKKNNHIHLLQFLGIPLCITPKELYEYNDLIDEKTWGYTAEDKKKMAAKKGKKKK